MYTFIDAQTHTSVCTYDVRLLLKPIGAAILILTTPWQQLARCQCPLLMNDSQCSPCLATLLKKDICEACIEREWYLTFRQADDGCWYSKTAFHKYYGDRCDWHWHWQQARKAPGPVHPFVRDCEWRKPNPRKVTHSPTVEAEAVSAPIPWQRGRPTGPVIFIGSGLVIIDRCLKFRQEDEIAISIAKALEEHGVSGETDCLACSQMPREMLLGCGHILTCSACLEKFTHCGICKEPVTHSLKIPVPDSDYLQNNNDSERSGSGALSPSDVDSE